MRFSRLVGPLVVALVLGAAPLLTSQQQQQQTPPPVQQADTSASVSERGARGQVQILREVFTYSQRGRRDPMVSLMTSAEIRPLISEVEVIAILYTGSSATSMATLRNLTNRRLIYRVKVGDAVGRMTVAQIERDEVVFTMDEFGFSRTARLQVKPDTTARTP